MIIRKKENDKAIREALSCVGDMKEILEAGGESNIESEIRPLFFPWKKYQSSIPLLTFWLFIIRNFLVWEDDFGRFHVQSKGGMR